MRTITKVFLVSVFALSAIFCIKTNAQTPHTIRGGVLNGKAISLPKPVYPEIARTAKVSGSVTVEITIDESGNVISATAVSGHPLLKDAAVQAASGAKFSPTLLSGQPIKVTGNLVYNFALENNNINGGVLNGKAISLPAPAYPQIAKTARASGSVNVQVVIDESGNVISASAISGHPLLKAAAVQAANGAKFSPTLLSGQPVKITGTLVYNFVLGMNWTDIGYELSNAAFSSGNTNSLSYSVATSLPGSDYETERGLLQSLSKGNTTADVNTQNLNTVINSLQSKLMSNPKNSWYFSLGVELAKTQNKIDDNDALGQSLESINRLLMNTPSDVPNEVKELVGQLAGRANTKAQAEANKQVVSSLISQIISACRKAEKSAE